MTVQDSHRDVALERVARMVVFSPCPNSTRATLSDAFHVEESRIRLLPGRSWRIAAVAATGTLQSELDFMRSHIFDVARVRGADIHPEGVVVVPSWVLALLNTDGTSVDVVDGRPVRHVYFDDR